MDAFDTMTPVPSEEIAELEEFILGVPTYEGFGPGGGATEIHAAIPVPWQSLSTVTANGTGIYPFSMTLEQLLKIYYVLSEIRLRFKLTQNGSEICASTMTLTRGVSKPGQYLSALWGHYDIEATFANNPINGPYRNSSVCQFFGSWDNGLPEFEGRVLASATVRFCWEGGFQTYVADPMNPLDEDQYVLIYPIQVVDFLNVQPAILISFSIIHLDSVSMGFDNSVRPTYYPGSPPLGTPAWEGYANQASFLPGIGGGDFQLYGADGNFQNWYAEFEWTPYRWLTMNGTFDEWTGNQLI